MFKLIHGKMKNINFDQKNVLCPIVMVLFVCAFLLSACHKSTEPEPPVIPTVKDSYSIRGLITDMRNGEVGNAVVKIQGMPSASTTTNAEGIFEINTIEKKGKYTIEISKEQYSTVTEVVDLTTSLVDITVKLPNEPVVLKAKATENNTLTLPEGLNTLQTSVKLDLPAGALTADVELAVTEIPNITTAPVSKAADNSVPLIVLDYKPDGLKFEKPCSLAISNPLDDYMLEGTKLQWYNPATKRWEDQPQEITINNDSYVTTITHFSAYKIVGFGDGQTTKSTEDILTLKYDNLNGRKDLTVTDIPYAYKRGTIYVTTPEAAAAAAGVTNKKVIDFLKTVVYATNTFTDVNTVYPINVSIPAGVRMDVKGVQSFTTTSYIFKFKKGNKPVTIELATKTAGSVSVSTSLYSKGHTGGSVN